MTNPRGVFDRIFSDDGSDARGAFLL